MENSLRDPQRSFTSPPVRRRRSTFFERRDSVVPQSATENSDPKVCKLNEVDEKHNQELKRYHDILLAEKNQWKAEVKSRQKRYYDMRQQIQLESKSSSRSKISYSVLSNEDLEYLKGKVNLFKLCELQTNLHKSYMKSTHLYKPIMEKDEVVFNYCNQKLSKINEYLLENSTLS